MSGRGVDQIPIRAPREWDPAWFERFVRDVLALADVRNAVEGTGIRILANPNEAATISSSEDLESLLDASLVTAGGSDLANARVLSGDGESITVTDGGPGGNVTVEVSWGLSLARLQPVPVLSVLGSTDSDEDTTAISPIVSSANDTLLRRVNDGTDDVLEFGKLTVGMAPDSVWTHEKIEDSAACSVLGRSANSAGVIADISAASDDQVLRRTGDALSFGDVPDAAIAETGVTQHEAALSIDFSQLDGVPQIPGGLQDFADDSAAASGGIDVGGLYRTGSIVKIRVS